MNRTITILTLVLLSQLSYAQITTTKVAENKEEITTEPYDSLKNFLEKDVYKYIGQDLYLKGKSESLRKYGYDGFSLDYTKSTLSNKSNVYKCCDSYNSKYDDLAGKYFNVIAVHKHPKAEESEYLYGKKFYLELKEKESGDKVYFEYDTQYEHSFPFIVVGFFEKLKKLAVGQKFVFGNTQLRFGDDELDVKTGNKITFKLGEKWECIDVTIEEKYYTLSLLLKDNQGQIMAIGYEMAIGENKFHDVFTEKEADMHEKKFGKTNWDKILNDKVVVGFTEEMVVLSWGKPEKINRASYGDQWVYDGQYLYFENGKLKSFN